MPKSISATPLFYIFSPSMVFQMVLVQHYVHVYIYIYIYHPCNCNRVCNFWFWPFPISSLLWFVSLSFWCIFLMLPQPASQWGCHDTLMPWSADARFGSWIFFSQKWEGCPFQNFGWRTREDICAVIIGTHVSWKRRESIIVCFKKHVISPLPWKLLVEWGTRWFPQRSNGMVRYHVGFMINA